MCSFYRRPSPPPRSWDTSWDASRDTSGRTEVQPESSKSGRWTEQNAAEVKVIIIKSVKSRKVGLRRAQTCRVEEKKKIKAFNTIPALFKSLFTPLSFGGGGAGAKWNPTRDADRSYL